MLKLSKNSSSAIPLDWFKVVFFTGKPLYVHCLIVKTMVFNGILIVKTMVFTGNTIVDRKNHGFL